METWFYHLEQRGLTETLAGLLQKSLDKGWRAVVRSPDPDRIADLDERLWTFEAGSFLPHGRAGAPYDDRQPVLLTTGMDTPNSAAFEVLLDGAAASGAPGLERCVILFASDAEGALQHARERWKALKDAGAPISYWREGTSGTWEKQA